MRNQENSSKFIYILYYNKQFYDVIIDSIIIILQYNNIVIKIILLNIGLKFIYI